MGRALSARRTLSPKLSVRHAIALYVDAAAEPYRACLIKVQRNQYVLAQAERHDEFDGHFRVTSCAYVNDKYLANAICTRTTRFDDTMGSMPKLVV